MPKRDAPGAADPRCGHADVCRQVAHKTGHEDWSGPDTAGSGAETTTFSPRWLQLGRSEGRKGLLARSTTEEALMALKDMDPMDLKA